jgi:PAS domain S-box-containing protein
VTDGGMLDPAVLGRILVLQATLQAAPDETRLMEMVASGLSGLPGVGACTICVDGILRAADRWHECQPLTDHRPDEDPRRACGQLPEQGWHRLELRSARSAYGWLFLEVRDATLLERYLPFVSNTANLVALRLETARSAAELAALNRRLDEQVREQTLQLRESEALLAQSQEIAHVGSWAFDVVRNQLTWSDEVYRIFGLRPQEFGATYEAFLASIHPDDRGMVHTGYSDSMSQGLDSYEVEHRVVAHDTGAVRLVHEKCVHVRDEAGRVLRSVGMVQDVTERRRAEEERLLLERQVLHAQKMESLGVLAGGIAHDFNNLLMAILGNADLALHALPAGSPARANLEEIDGAAHRAADFAQQMLAYSGKGRFVIERIDAGGLVREMAHLLEVVIGKGVLLKFDFAANVPHFEGDATQIRQVIMNLITNASEAIGGRSGVIGLSTGAARWSRAELDAHGEPFRTYGDDLVPDAAYVGVEVTDTGCGMDPATLDRIFDPFFTTKFTGRGLGMSAVLGIVRGHRGALQVRSAVGKGTTFRVLFPAAPELEADSSQGKAGAPPAAEWRGTGTILLVDDEESVRTVSRRMLEHLGFSRVLTAADGRQALEAFRTHAPELSAVLLDLTMPHMDGEKAFAAIREVRRDVPVILCSGYSSQEAMQRFLTPGLAGFLQKPYSVAALRAALRDALDREDDEPQ